MERMKTTLPPDALHDRYFRSVSTSAGGDVDASTLFHYRQRGDIVWATYDGGHVAHGTLIARVLADGRLDMGYQQVGTDRVLKCGRCISSPRLLDDGRLALEEVWQWTEGASGAGESRLEEVAPDDATGKLAREVPSAQPLG